MTIRMVAFAVIAALLLTGGALAASPSPENGTTAIQPMAQQAATLTSQEAEAAALTHAGLTAQEVTQLQSHLDRENGNLEWDVQFRQGDYEFDYAIQAETGAILKWDKEYDPLTPIPPATEALKELSTAEVLEIALTHAGLSMDQVSHIYTRYELDDGIPEWEVDFRSGDWEYDYTVHAETGAILSWEKEYDAPRTSARESASKDSGSAKTTSKDSGSAKTTSKETAPPATEAPSEPTQNQRLSASEAKSIALSHAGLSSGQVTGLRAEFDYDNGVPEYDVEFYYNGYEYEYEIHAETGNIRSWDKDYDD